MDKREVINLVAKFVPRRTLFFDVIVTEHCNLNCKGCGSFMPLADEEYIDLEDLEKDYKRLADLSGGVMHHINLLGGEPLLHKDIKAIIKMTRRYFPIGVINLVTNGILLPKMDEEFWDICHAQQIDVCPTKYPIKVDYKNLEKKAEEKRVKYHYFGDATGCMWTHKVIDISGSRFENCSFMYCPNANLCPVLKHGKIFPCPTARHIDKFNKAYNTELHICEKDYIDIYKIDKLEDIMNFLTKPIPFCRYCNTPAIKETDWGISKGDIAEWT